jgi:hypothetical protein
VEVALAGPAFDVVAHVLAHVAVPARAEIVTRAASLFDPRYVAWAARSLPEGAVLPAARDAELIGALLGATPGGHRLQGLLRAHDDLEGLVHSATHDLPAGALEGLAAERPDLVELVRCAAALAAPDYAEAWESLGLAGACDPVRDALAASGLRSLGGARVLLSHPLGARGRGFGDAVMIGAPTDWSGLGAADVAVRAAHEHAVEIASVHVRVADDAERWARTEALALGALATRLEGTPLAAAHAAYMTSLDLSGLPTEVDGAVLARVVEEL